jgi:hypothetical protein
VINTTVTVEEVSEDPDKEQDPRLGGGWGWLPGAGMFSSGKEQGSTSTREPSPEEKALKDYEKELFQKYDQELSEREARKGGGKGWRWWR